MRLILNMLWHLGLCNYYTFSDEEKAGMDAAFAEYKQRLKNVEMAKKLNDVDTIDMLTQEISSLNEKIKMQQDAMDRVFKSLGPEKCTGDCPPNAKGAYYGCYALKGACAFCPGATVPGGYMQQGRSM